MTQEIRGTILTSDGWIEGERRADAGRQGPLILPGFIDLHVHGGGGRDVMDGGDAPSAIARIHARHGTTSLLATTMTAPPEDIDVALAAIGAAVRERVPGGARVLGAHLEGPYISAGKLGAQPNFATNATLAEVQRLAALAPLHVITIAPEVDGHLELVRLLKDLGIRAQIGHSDGSYEDGAKALENGAAGFTHLFNAMTGLHHRAPGMVGAALAHAEYAELIPDLLHVHPGAIKVALRCIPKLYCVSDSTPATGMPDGDYMLGRMKVHKCMGGVRLADGTLAGSTLTMDQALRNLVSLGLDLADASARVSANAADYLGIADRGRLAAGNHADFVVLDRDLQLTAVYVEGEKIDIANA
jgi:N-acetylglucosamine-6-phosphate deacetylase